MFFDLRWKNCFCVAPKGRPGMVFRYTMPCSTRRDLSNVLLFTQSKF